MKSIFIPFLFFFLFIPNIHAQTLDESSTHGTIEIAEGEEVYVYDQSQLSADFRNKSNIFFQGSEYYTRDRYMPTYDYECRYHPMAELNLEKVLFSIIPETTIQKMLELTKKGYVWFSISMHVNMETWMVQEAQFNISGKWDKELFPLSKLIEIEKALKKVKIEMRRRFLNQTCSYDTKGRYYSMSYNLDLKK